MSYDLEKAKIGKKLFESIELKLDSCGLDYGQSVTNLLPWSEDVSQWNLFYSPLIVSNEIVAPDGTLTADRVEDDNPTSTSLIYQVLGAATASQQYTFSVFLKSGNAADSTFNCYVSGETEVNANITWGDNPTITNGEIIHVVGDWYRVSITLTAIGTGALIFRIWPRNRGTSANLGYIYVWGGQVVAGAAPGHYVKTTTASATKACTASESAGDECYNTIDTCQDLDNYTKLIKSYGHGSKHYQPPGEILQFPCLEKVTLSPAIAEPGKLGVRATLTASCTDFPHHDRGIDLYHSTRAYDAATQGTYFGKMMARNPFYYARPLTYKRGFIADTFSWGDFQSRAYLMKEIHGPNELGLVDIKAHDRLILAQDDTVQIPALSEGHLNADITDSATSFDCEAGDGAGYGASGTIRIGKEEMTYTISTDTFTVVRGVNGTEKKAHDAGELIQEAKVFTDVNVVDILHEILTDYVGIDETNIPYDAGLTIPTGTNDKWDDLKENWLTGSNLQRTISDPTGTREIIEEVLEQTNLMMWLDLVDDEILLAAYVPPLGNATLNTYIDDINFIGKPSVKREEKRNVTQVWVHWSKINNAEGDSADNYRYIDIFADPEIEGSDRRGKAKIVKIYASWLPALAQVARLGGRVVSRFAKTPNLVDFSLDTRDDDLAIGDLCYIETKQLQDVTGAAITEQVQVISRDDSKDPVMYKALTARFTGRYGFIAPNGLSDYSSATADQQRRYAFICANTGVFPDGEKAYKII